VREKILRNDFDEQLWERLLLLMHDSDFCRRWKHWDGEHFQS